MKPGPRVLGIVLAAGASRRAGCVKALAELEGRALVDIISGTLLAGGCERVLVVVGPPHQSAIERALEGRRERFVVENPEPGLGMLHSLQIGIAEARCRDAGAVVVGLVDHPGVRSGTVAELIGSWERGSGGVVLRPQYRNHRGHPFLIDRAGFDTIARAEPTAITRDVLLQAGDRVVVVVDDPGVVEDIDTRAGLARIGARVPSRFG